MTQQPNESTTRIQRKEGSVWFRKDDVAMTLENENEQM